MTEAQVTMQDVAFGGAGVGRLPDGKVVFVPYTLTGEVVRIRLDKSHQNFARGELMEVLDPSPYRVEPPCKYFGICGGCAYQHVAYAEQLRIKEKQLQDTFVRIGGFTQLPPIQVEASPQPYGYRNKIVVHRGKSGQVGFYATDQRSIVDIESCLIASDTVNTRLTALRQAPRTPRHTTLSDPEQREDTPVGSFHQINTPMAQQLLTWVRTQIRKGTQTRVSSEICSTLLDLYCGAGFFTLGLADSFSAVWGVDRDEQAIHMARERAQKIGFSHTRFVAADVEACLDRVLKTQPGDAVTLLVDPPRAGFPQHVIERLAHIPHLTQILYVSCNPATLVRDLKRFLHSSAHASCRYQVCALGLFDMFPQTAHIETVAVLQSA